jgi:hypothetical protein
MTEDIYCKVCQSCGISDCCSPSICQADKDGLYCRSNLNEMRVAFWTLKDLYNWLCEDKEANKVIIDKINEIEDGYEENFSNP